MRSAIWLLTKALKPVAARWARPRYFGRHDLASIGACRIAIVACHWVGDTFWATQVIEPLQRRFPGSEVYAISKPSGLELWNGLVEADHRIAAAAVVSDRRREEVSWPAIAARAAELRAIGFDLVIDLTGNRYSAYFTFLLRPAVALGFDGGELGWLYSQRVADAARPKRHLSERPFRVIEPLLSGWGEPFAYPRPLRPPTPACPPDEVRRALNLPDGPYYVISPGAGWAAKEWKAENFIAAGRRLRKPGARIVVAGSQGQGAICQRVAGEIDGAVTLVGQSIGRLAALLQQAEGVLCNDSGAGHLAAAMGRRTAVVFIKSRGGRLVTDPDLCAPLGPPGTAKVFYSDAEIADVVEFLEGAGLPY